MRGWRIWHYTNDSAPFAYLAMTSSANAFNTGGVMFNH